MRYLFVTIYFLLITVSAHTQTSKDEAISFLTNVKEVYETAESYDMIITLQSSAIDEEESQMMRQQYRSIKNGNNFYIQTPVLSTLVTENQTLVIDNSQKQVQLQTNHPTDGLNLVKEKSNFLPDLQELSNSILSVEENEMEYSISFQENGSHYDISVYTFDKTNYLIKSVKYLINEPQGGQASEIVLHYSENHINSEVDLNFFDISAIIKEKNGEWKLAEKYQEYTLLNTEK